ncbi:MAG: UbiA family prenyltransferase [Candidatus Aenigmarchaeota archaeon]|nr:UbiA family prenyltransferase [Candidatus Aenigmarchaeota archaeon]
MNPFLRIMRPSVCMMSLLGILVGSIVAGVASPLLILLAIVAAILITGAGNVVNDYFDVETDRVNAPHRPIPAGKVSLKGALWFFAVLNIIGVVLAVFVSWEFLGIALFNVLVSFVYAWKLKKAPFVGNVAVSYLGASAFLAAGLIEGLPGLPIITLALIAFFGTISREIFKDIRDVAGDKKIGAKTLPLIWGLGKSRGLAIAFLAIGCILLALPVPMFSLFYLVGAVPAAALCIFAATRKPARAEKLVKIAIFLVLLGFILGSIF